MLIGNKILFCRKRAGMSQEALAAKLSISRQAVSRWETGEAIPDTEKIIQLSRLFHVSTDYLLLDEIEAQQTEEHSIEEYPTDIQENSLKERRRRLRIWFGKWLLVIGLIALASTLAGAGIYSIILTEWYTEWGRFGTALFRTWIIVPLVLSFCVAIAGGIILWDEYQKED